MQALRAFQDLSQKWHVLFDLSKASRNQQRPLPVREPCVGAPSCCHVRSPTAGTILLEKLRVGDACGTCSCGGPASHAQQGARHVNEDFLHLPDQLIRRLHATT